MKVKSVFSAALLALAAYALPLHGARAATLYDGTSLVQGQSAFVQTFNVTSPGVLTVTLTDIPWLDTVSGLTGFLTTASGVVGSSMGAGAQSYDVSAGTVYAHWFGQAQGNYDIGVVGVNVSFQPSGTAVPLPTTLILMLSGLGLLFGWQSRKSPALAL
jgi:hypothetical protein